MTDVVFDLYLLAAALGLVPVVAFAGLPVLSQSAFLAVGAIGAMQLERAGLPIGSAVLLSIVAGGVLGPAAGAIFGGAIALPITALCYLALLSRTVVATHGQQASLEWYPIGRLVGWAAIIAGVLAGIGDHRRDDDLAGDRNGGPWRLDRDELVHAGLV